jgi:hypothetical protein
VKPGLFTDLVGGYSVEKPVTFDRDSFDTIGKNGMITAFP